METKEEKEEKDKQFRIKELYERMALLYKMEEYLKEYFNKNKPEFGELELMEINNDKLKFIEIKIHNEKIKNDPWYVLGNFLSEIEYDLMTLQGSYYSQPLS